MNRTGWGILRLLVLLTAFGLLYPAWAAAETWKIGVIGALSGSKAPYGVSQLQGAQVAADEINQAGGIRGRMLELSAADDRGDMGLVGELMTSLIFQDHVVAVVGSVDSGCTHVVSMVSVKTQVPHFTCVATDPSLTRAGNPWTFRTLADDDRQSEALVTYLASQTTLRRIGVIAIDSRYGKMGAKTLVRRSGNLGLQVAGPFWVKNEEISVQKAVQVVLAEPADAVILWTLADEGVKLVKALRTAGFRGLVLGGDGLASPAFFAQADPAIERVVLTCPYDESLDTRENRTLKELYKNRFFVLPDSFAAHAYDTTRLIAQAIAKSDGSRQGLREAIAGLMPFPGATGLLRLDASGNDERPVRLAVCENRRLRLLDEAPR